MRVWRVAAPRRLESAVRRFPDNQAVADQLPDFQNDTTGIRRSARRSRCRHARQPIIREPRAVAAALLAITCCLGCDSGHTLRRDDSARSASGEALAATAKGARQEVPYTTRPLDVFGKVTGVVEIDGAPPPDTVIQPPPELAPVCFAFTQRRIDRSGSRVAGVVVWIEGLRSGKPLPVERRFEIANDRCLLVPEVQPALAGGTLNVQNLDATDHRTRITRLDGGEVLATIRESEEGQVVPNEHVLSRPGVLHLTCDVHPWTQAWIAVFDHPYYGLTGRDGAFALDSIPPGRYAIRAWHPRLGAMADSLTIQAGQTVTLALRAKAAP
jgi:hypothetical protein